MRPLQLAGAEGDLTCITGERMGRLNIRLGRDLRRHGEGCERNGRLYGTVVVEKAGSSREIILGHEWGLWAGFWESYVTGWEANFAASTQRRL